MTPENLLHLPTTTQKCTLGCPILDTILGGGIPCNSITELVAESGSGKTQTCLQLSLCAQLPISLGGLNASTLYIHTEFPFPMRRLHSLSQIFAHRHNKNNDNYNPCDYIYVQSIHSADQLLDIMPKIESFLLNLNTQLPVRLIVIDSIAALFRADYENTRGDLKRRSVMFFRISGKLKELARRFNLAVVITNQVVDYVGSGEGVNGMRIGNLESLFSSGRRVCAALGLAWANCVNSRLFLSREENGGEKRRRVHVVFAPHLPAVSCEFVIRKEGVFGVKR